MAQLIIRELNRDRSDELEIYERALYHAFKSYHQEVFDNLWTFDHAAERASPLIPYAGQRIMIAEADGALIGAAAINLDMATQLQIEKCGFTVNKIPGKTAEGLALFSSRLVVGREIVVARLLDATVAMLRSASISTFWGSCDKKRLLGYLQLGFRNIAKVHFNGQDEFLLQRTLAV